MLNIEHALTDDDVGGVFRRLDEFPELDVLAAYMVFLKSQPDSPWSPYINSLPRTVATPLAFTEDELEHLQSSHVRLCVMKDVV